MDLADRLRLARGNQAVCHSEPKLLLGPNVPSPLHGVAPRTILGPKWWNETRQAAYRSTNFHCLACGVHKCLAEYRKWLEGHEVYRINYRLGRATYIRTVPLCHLCHNYIHDGRLEALLQEGKINHGKYAAVLQHGDRVLAEAGLKRSNRLERDKKMLAAIQAGNVAPWEQWRLVLFDKQYPPLFRSEQEWIKNYP